MMKKYNCPELELISVNTTDIMSASTEGDGNDPYRSAGDWRDAIDSINIVANGF